MTQSKAHADHYAGPLNPFAALWGLLPYMPVQQFHTRRTMVNSRTSVCQRATRILMICFVVTVGTMLMHRPAHAHKVNVFAFVEGDRVVVEGYFGGKVKAQDCPVEVLDEAGKTIHQGKTDTKGIYSFKLADLPAFSGSLKIVLQAGMGHKAEYTLPASDIPGSENRQTSSEGLPRETPSEQVPAASPAVPNPTRADTFRSVDQGAITAALETALDKKLAPIVRMLGQQEKLLLEQKMGGPKMTDIIGGIGWIMGLVGIATFFWGRSRPDK